MYKDYQFNQTSETAASKIPQLFNKSQRKVQVKNFLSGQGVKDAILKDNDSVIKELKSKHY